VPVKSKNSNSAEARTREGAEIKNPPRINGRDIYMDGLVSTGK
jgi:hypothetical protein